MTTPSPITGNPSKHLFDETVLGRHTARYFLDESIQFIFVEAPHWLDEAYSSAMALTDTGILARNQSNVRRVSALLAKRGFPFRRGVDLGGGHGLFVRGMRDAGYPFYWQDKYAENLLARGFEAADETHDVAVAFEVLEHLPDPLGFLREMRGRYTFETCFFTATVFPEGTVPERDWWYWAFESGQHISFFSKTALRAIGEGLSMSLFQFGGDLFAFSSHDLSRFSGKPSVIDRLRPGPVRAASLTQSDFEMMRDRLRSNFARD